MFRESYSDSEENIYGDGRFNAGGMFVYKQKKTETFQINGDNLTTEILCKLGKNENIFIEVNIDRILKDGVCDLTVQ